MWYLISVSDLEQYLDEDREIFLVDIRDWKSFRRGHIRGAVNIPEEEIQDRIGELPKNQLIVMYCYHGPQSMLASKELARAGYQVADVYGGIQAYGGKYLVSGER